MQLRRLGVELALFPLRCVLFPGRPLPLHIFEPRYRRLLADCLDGDRQFGVVAIRSGNEVGGCAATFDVGTIAHIEQWEHLPDGRAAIVTRGTQRFRILRHLPPAPYQRATVQPLADDPSALADEERSAELRALLTPYLASLGAPEELLAHLPHDPTELSWLAAAAVQVEVPTQQRLLEFDEPGRRLDALLAMLRRENGIMRHFGAVGSLQPLNPNGAQLN